jgi:hypothetical protein
VRWTALALACLALAGCESTQEKSARLEKVSKRRAVAANAAGLHIATPSKTIHVVSATALRGEAPTVAVTLRNTGGAQREVPVEVSVAQSGGPAYANTAPGLARSLVSLAYVPAHGTAVWVDDQVTLTGDPGAASAKVGDGKPAAAAAAGVVIGSHKLESEAGGGEVVTGTVANRSGGEQHELAVYAVARRGGRVVAAGRAIVSALAPGGSERFQIFLTGSARGAQLTLAAPAAPAG